MSTPDLFNLGKTETAADEKQNTTEKTVSKSSLDIDDNETDSAVPQTTELDMLKQRARLMGLTFSNNIGAEALNAKIQAKLDGDAAQQAAPEENDDEDHDEDQDENQEQDDEPVETTQVKSGGAAAAFSSRDEDVASARAAAEARAKRLSSKNKKMSLRQRLLRDAMKMVRVRITNLDPKKKDLPGEIITVANEYIGTVKKYVPFGEVTDNGYHIPHCIYTVLRSKKFLSIKVTKKNGREHVETQFAKEFALEVLPTLTVDELARLASAQLAAGSVE